MHSNTQSKDTFLSFFYVSTFSLLMNESSAGFHIIKFLGKTDFFLFLRKEKICFFMVWKRMFEKRPAVSKNNAANLLQYGIWIFKK